MNEAYWFDICRWPSGLTSSFDQRANIANSNIDDMYVMKKMTFYLCIPICIITSSVMPEPGGRGATAPPQYLVAA